MERERERENILLVVSESYIHGSIHTVIRIRRDLT